MRAIDWNRVADVQGIDAFNRAERVGGVNAPADGGVACRWEVGLRLLWLSCIIPKDTGPLLDSLVVVGRQKSLALSVIKMFVGDLTTNRVDAAMIHLEARACAGVAWVHSHHNVGPFVPASAMFSAISLDDLLTAAP